MQYNAIQTEIIAVQRADEKVESEDPYRYLKRAIKLAKYGWRCLKGAAIWAPAGAVFGFSEGGRWGAAAGGATLAAAGCAYGELKGTLSPDPTLL